MGIKLEDLPLAEAIKIGLGHLHPDRAGNGSRCPGDASPGAATVPDPDGMNKAERRYGDRLELFRRDGRIREYAFEPEKLRIAGRTFYTPDYRVVLLSGAIEFHEVKGFLRDDAGVKIKVAADKHRCYTFRIAFVRPRGAFDVRLVTPAGGIAAAGGWDP